MTEPDVALTDFALAIECGIIATMLWRQHGRSRALPFWLELYFATAGVASLCGGLVHGFFLDTDTVGHAVLWPTTLLAIGANAVTAWAIAARLLFSVRAARAITAIAYLVLAAYGSIVLMGTNAFRVAIGMAVPAVIVLLLALCVTCWREGRPGSLVTAIGLALTLVAALLQQLGVGLHPSYFNHNALAHVVQAVALWLIYRGGTRLVAVESNASRATSGDDERPGTWSRG